MNLDPTTSFGQRVLHHLRHDQHIWLTVVDARGRPHPNPVWFVWDGETLLIYTRPDARRLRHLAHNPQVALHFDTDLWGDDVTVINGTAQVDGDAPKVLDNLAYLEKYRQGMVHIDMTPEVYSETYSVAIRVRPERVRGYYVPPGEKPAV